MSNTLQVAIQDLYPDETSHCFGCGNRNSHGHQLKSYWNGGAALASFSPGPYHTAIPGFVYGGLLASLVDCHATATAAAAACHAKNCELTTDTLPRFVTAALQVDFLLPTPIGTELKLRGQAREIRERKVTVDVTLSAHDKPTVAGSVVCVLLPASMLSAD
jgi:acyl-coenzyme A thioesterase PaaI-like protein